MGKPKSPPRFRENQTGATAKFVRVPPRKARLVMDAVRGKYVSDALAILKFVPNQAARMIEEVIKSAVANAENGRPYSEETGRPLAALDTDNLKLVRAWVDEGPRIKRIQPRAQGRAYRIVKRMSHISVIIEEAAPKPRPQRRSAARRTTVAATAAAKPAAKAAEKPAGRPAATKREKAAPAPAPAPAAVEERTTQPDETMPMTTSPEPQEEGSGAAVEVIPTQSPAADSADDAPAEKQPEGE